MFSFWPRFSAFCPVGLLLLARFPLRWICRRQECGHKRRNTAHCGWCWRGDALCHLCFWDGDGVHWRFIYTPQAGDVDLDGVVLSSPVDLKWWNVHRFEWQCAFSPDFYVAEYFRSQNRLPVFVDGFCGQRLYFIWHTLRESSCVFNGSRWNVHCASVGTYFDSSGDLQTAAWAASFWLWPCYSCPKRNPYWGTKNKIMFKWPVFWNYAWGLHKFNFKSLAFWCSCCYARVCCNGDWVGTVNGLSYIDLLYNLTTNSSGSNAYASLSMPSADQFAVVPGDDTVVSAWMGLTSYSSVGDRVLLLFQIDLIQRGVYLAETNKSYSSVTPFASCKLQPNWLMEQPPPSLIQACILESQMEDHVISIRIAGYQMERGFSNILYPDNKRNGDAASGYPHHSDWRVVLMRQRSVDSPVCYSIRRWIFYPRIAEIGDGSSNNDCLWRSMMLLLMLERVYIYRALHNLDIVLVRIRLGIRCAKDWFMHRMMRLQPRMELWGVWIRVLHFPVSINWSLAGFIWQ